MAQPATRLFYRLQKTIILHVLGRDTNGTENVQRFEQHFGVVGIKCNEAHLAPGASDCITETKLAGPLTSTAFFRAISASSVNRTKPYLFFWSGIKKMDFFCPKPKQVVFFYSPESKISIFFSPNRNIYIYISISAPPRKKMPRLHHQDVEMGFAPT